MKLRDLDKHLSGNKPLTLCLRWLRTCMAKCESWDTNQRLAATQALQEAEEVLEMELSPNMTPEMLQALAMKSPKENPVEKLMRECREEGKQPTYEDLLSLHLYESALRSKIRATQALLGDIKLRIAFIDWPAEEFWNAGTAEHPRWVPDWRDELRMIHAALHGLPMPLPGAASSPEVLPWHRIPVEHRPSHLSEGAKRLHKLHLAWLRFKEHGEDPDEPVLAYENLAAAMGQVFDKSQPTGGSLTVTSTSAARAPEQEAR